ncbi:UDP-4-amino-4,6-dideoxy-N-acetyl-beta-L-altrosamine transaminase [Ferviditalea candida]|uniref:UDP-4-amino-4, 6-dideoxy-N-acetyl-beta-L-altrosamine transaminase n=1 Tax=Ferviditalea candida TaxID=3108399 RepID=A0ABU5ZI91_9BACL|nr:UDP-4-amino-4,6-dideoxy-N-acetyl-beta-L-altrosamine transaminase [Paenibacillaceae bacterium T2]
MGTLALFGGKPVRDSFLPYGHHWLDEDDMQQVVQTLKSPVITQGSVVEQFEEAVADYTGARYAVAFSSGTAALHGACHAAGLENGDELLTSANTFAASANCALYVGAQPVFADIDPRTYNIDPGGIENRLSERTRAIVPVDFSGQPADLDPIMKLAEKHELVVIEDAAHALGALYRGRKVGTLADMTMFSFHPVKLVTTGEGGMIVTDHREWYEKLKSFRTHGVSKEPSRMGRYEGPWYYEMNDLGYNYRMTDFQAALGVSQIKKIDRFLYLRNQWAQLYQQAFSGIDGIIPPYQPDDIRSGWHLYVIRLELEKLKTGRKEIFEALRAENIGVHVHYLPVYWHPYYEKLGYRRGLCPQAEAYYQTAITLPLFPKMTKSDVETVVEAVKKVVRFFRK